MLYRTRVSRDRKTNIYIKSETRVNIVFIRYTNHNEYNEIRPRRNSILIIYNAYLYTHIICIYIISYIPVCMYYKDMCFIFTRLKISSSDHKLYHASWHQWRQLLRFDLHHQIFTLFWKRYTSNSIILFGIWSKPLYILDRFFT